MGRRILYQIIAIFGFWCCGHAFADVNKADAYILSLSDIHFDPFVYCTTKPCPLIAKLLQTEASLWGKMFSQFPQAMPAYKHSTNYALLHSALVAAKNEMAKHDAQFVLLLGDYLGHDYKRNFKRYSPIKSSYAYSLFVNKTMQFLVAEFKQYFPEKSVYAVLGNNDSYSGDYVYSLSNGFFGEMGSLWSSLIKAPPLRAQMKSQFSRAGYFALTLPENNIRLIALNSNLFSYKTWGKRVKEEAWIELHWLQQQLAEVKVNQQKALLIMHIPETIDLYASMHAPLFTLIPLWQKDYIHYYEDLIKAYAPNIMGILVGHVHADYFQLLDEARVKVPQSSTPSISPIFGNNPGFKLYAYDTHTLKLVDFVSYFYPLNPKRIFATGYGFNQINSIDCQNYPTNLHQSSVLSNLSGLFVPAPSNPVWAPYYQCQM